MIEDELKELSLHQMKNEMHFKAFEMRDKNKTITQEEANKLNNMLVEIVEQLVEFDYDPSCDYMVDFDSFVKDNEYYNRFAW